MVCLIGGTAQSFFSWCYQGEGKPLYNVSNMSSSKMSEIRAEPSIIGISPSSYSSSQISCFEIESYRVSPLPPCQRNCKYIELRPRSLPSSRPDSPDGIGLDRMSPATKCCIQVIRFVQRCRPPPRTRSALATRHQ